MDRPGDQRHAVRLAAALLVATAVAAGACTPARSPDDSASRQDRVAEQPRYLRFEFSSESSRPAEDWTGRTTGSGWRDLEGERLRVTTFNKNARVTDELLVRDGFERSMSVDRHGHTLSSESDSHIVGRPYELIRYYDEETAALAGAAGPATETVQGAETITVRLPATEGAPETLVSVRTSDGLPVRIVTSESSGATTYTVEVSPIEAEDLPADAFELDFPEDAWPQVARTLDTSEAAALGAPDVYWLGDAYGGLPRTEHFYRTSQPPGGTMSHGAGAWPAWSWTSFARAGVSTSYWRGGDDRAFDTTVTSQGFQGWSTRWPDIKVSSIAVPDVEAWLGLKGDLGDGVKQALREALGASEPVEIPTEPYGDPRELAAKRFGDTLVIVDTTPGLASRAIEDVRPVPR